MMKPLFVAVFGIALALSGIYTVSGQFGDKSPAVLTTVSVAPIRSGQDSQAMLAPIDPAFVGTALQDLTASQPSVTSDLQNFVSQVHQVAQNNTQSQVQSSANAASSNGTNSTSTSVTTNNGVTTTTVTNNGVTTTTTTGTPTNTTTTTAASDALAKAVDAYNQAVSRVTALDLPPDVKAALMDYLTALRAQLLAISVPDQLTAAQVAAMTNNSAVDALNAFLANVNNLNMTNGDKTATFTALLSALANVPGVNTNFTLTPSTQPSVTPVMPAMPTMSGLPELMTPTSAQIQAAIDRAMENLETQRNLTASLQMQTNNALLNSQLPGMNSGFNTTFLNNLNLGTLNQAH